MKIIGDFLMPLPCSRRINCAPLASRVRAALTAEVKEATQVDGIRVVAAPLSKTALLELIKRQAAMSGSLKLNY